MVSECTTVAQHHISLKMPGVVLQNYFTQAAGGSNAAPDKPSSTITTPIPTAGPQMANPEGPTAAVAPMVPGDAMATAVENMPTVGAANFTLPYTPAHLPAAHAEAGNIAGTVIQHDLAVFRQQEEEAARQADVELGSVFRDLKVPKKYKVCAASPACNVSWPDSKS